MSAMVSVRRALSLHIATSPRWSHRTSVGAIEDACLLARVTHAHRPDACRGGDKEATGNP